MNGTSSKEKILETAAQLIGQYGYDATSVQEICAAAGVSKGAFYHYFSTKQNLFVSLMEEWALKVQQDLRGDDRFGEKIPANLFEMTKRSNIAFSAAPKGFPILVEFWRQAKLEPEIWERAVQPYFSYLKFFETAIDKGKEEGTIDPEVSTSSGAHLLLAFAMGYLLQSAINPDSGDWQQLADDGMQIILDGLRRKA